MRVLSLIASSTEMVAALGGESLLVGRSHECDFPLTVKLLPQVTKPAFETGGTSAEIDAEVKRRLRDALSIYEVDREKLAELNPDVILTQTQCEVCAVSLKDVEAALEGSTGKPVKVVSLQPNSLADIFDDIRRVGRAIGKEAQGDCYAAELRGKISAVSRVARRVLGQAPKPKVAIIEWIDPLMAAGNWMPELVDLAQGENLFGEAGKHSPWMKMEELVKKDPDVVIISPCGFDLARTKKELHLLTENPLFRSLRAFREGRVAIADGNAYFNRPGPRTLQALEIIAEILYPGAFDFERPLLLDGSRGFEWVSQK
ncbi:MAG: cobalamin-binding protein [Cryobacterium sp.]|nr:cobalamin-binding protein [Oligoflexia bacterium]